MEQKGEIENKRGSREMEKNVQYNASVSLIYSALVCAVNNLYIDICTNI